MRVVDIAGDPRVAFDTATEILGKESDKVNAFVCLEAQAGREVATVLNNRSVKDKVVIAMDTDADTLDWIDKGVIAATISQKPYTMSLVGLHMLDDLYHNKLSKLDSDWSKDSFAPIPAFVDTGKEVMDEEQYQGVPRSERGSDQSGQIAVRADSPHGGIDFSVAGLARKQVGQGFARRV